MAKFSASVLATIVSLSLDLNYKGKKLAKTKLAVCEIIATEIGSGFTAEQVSKFLKRETYADFWEGYDKEHAKPVKVKKEKMFVESTFAGQEQSRDKDLPVLADGDYIISSCSNNTLPHAAFKTLQSMAADYDARLILMGIKYVKPMPAEQRADWKHADCFKPYLLDGDCWLGGFGQVKLMDSAAIIPTQAKPINNAAQLNKNESLTMVASPKRQLKSLPRAKDGNFKWAYTTSSVSQLFYTDTGAGHKGESSHTFGGVFISVRNGVINHRPLVANEQGYITDCGTVYTPNGEKFEAEKPCVVLGDLHCEKMCVDSWERTLNWLCDVEPQQIAVHDSLDMMSRNHHNRQSGRFLYQMGSRAVLDDLQAMIDHLNQLAEIAPIFVVESNHDLALDTWLDDNRYNADQDPINAKTYYALKLAILEMIDDGDDLTMIDLACHELVERLERPLSDNIRFGRIDELELFNGVQVDMHGHVGLSGARGSMATFKKVGLTCVTGHTHSPDQDGDAVTVGVTGSLSMGYNKGLTAWDRANAIINTDSTVQLVPLYQIGESQY